MNSTLKMDSFRPDLVAKVRAGLQKAADENTRRIESNILALDATQSVSAQKRRGSLNKTLQRDSQPSTR
jgi:hypothetical protein